CQHYYTSPCSF
nr:immunoglobulin light chain junction region [Macaca mulatta]